MWTTEDHTVTAGHSVTPASWQAGLDELLSRVAGRFGRVEPRRHARALVLGLLADLPRKNCWTLAEHAGDTTPDGLQHLQAGAVWDEHAVRDDLRDYVVEHLADPAAVLVVDETGDLKKGTTTVGVGRQYGDRGHQLRWSRWRRRQQARARACHYRRQAPSNHEDHDLRLEY